MPLPHAVTGTSALIDALLLAHTDFLLKSTSSLSEFSLWYNPVRAAPLKLAVAPRTALHMCLTW